MRGMLIVFSAPSGAGKTTIINEIMQRHQGKFEYSISATTRAPRKNEVHGISYYFLSDTEFQKKIKAKEFVEWAVVHDYYYGTLKNVTEQKLNAGKKLFFDLDVKGGLAIKNLYPENTLLIFIAPPSSEALIERLKQRNTESHAQIEKRLERFSMEMEQAKHYDVRIINDDLESAVNQVTEAINQFEHGIEKSVDV